jgi:hypothetical protein
LRLENWSRRQHPISITRRSKTIHLDVALQSSTQWGTLHHIASCKWPDKSKSEINQGYVWQKPSSKWHTVFVQIPTFVLFFVFALVLFFFDFGQFVYTLIWNCFFHAQAIFQSQSVYTNWPKSKKNKTKAKTKNKTKVGICTVEDCNATSRCIVLDRLVMEMGCCLLDIYPYPFFFILKYLLCHKWRKVPNFLHYYDKIAKCL